ncbi:hypothetical protein DFP73DRAFT_606156, partial [Morchella snyderi]
RLYVVNPHPPLPALPPPQVHAHLAHHLLLHPPPAHLRALAIAVPPTAHPHLIHHQPVLAHLLQHIPKQPQPLHRPQPRPRRLPPTAAALKTRIIHAPHAVAPEGNHTVPPHACARAVALGRAPLGAAPPRRNKHHQRALVHEHGQRRRERERALPVAQVRARGRRDVGGRGFGGVQRCPEALVGGVARGDGLWDEVQGRAREAWLGEVGEEGGPGAGGRVGGEGDGEEWGGHCGCGLWCFL